MSSYRDDMNDTAVASDSNWMGLRSIAESAARASNAILSAVLVLHMGSAMAGDTVEMAENAMLMIHAPWTYTAGNSAELRAVADQLDTWAAAMASSYGTRMGDKDAALALKALPPDVGVSEGIRLALRALGK